jgi:hypothetical protein
MISLKTHTEQEREMKLASLRIQDLCTKATSSNGNLVQQNNWQPAA